MESANNHSLICTGIVTWRKLTHKGEKGIRRDKERHGFTDKLIN